MAYRYEVRSSTKAKKRPGKSMVARGKKPAVGQGGRFAALRKGLAKKGGIKSPGAVTAFIGRKKYGGARFQKMATTGKRRA